MTAVSIRYMNTSATERIETMNSDSRFHVEDVWAIEPRQAVFSLYLGREALPASPAGSAARLVTGGRIYTVSRLDGEDGWTIDGESLPNGLPIFFNGEGARYTLLRVIDDAEIAAALDAAAGLVTV
jgi:hypothetical protein